MKLTKIFFLLAIAVAGSLQVNAQAPGHQSYVANKNGIGYFALSANDKAAPIYTGDDEYPGVKRAINSLMGDVRSVTRSAPALVTETKGLKQIVLIGTLGKNPKIDQLVKENKLNVTDIAGKWETYLIQVVQKPFPGVDQALVITGSDKRGTIFGIYDVSAQIGISPWYWWADVPVKEQKNLYILPGRHTDGTPAVKYRGIFINDEAPAFSGWTKEKFGGVNHKMYEKMFELILRLKGNYLWPAMWGNAFNDDDKLNPVLADEYGVVMGTSHHEPMDRAQQEWKRYGKGEWNYEKNKEILQDFWRKGIENMGTKETIVTVGMRGDGDMPMTEGSNIALLENIVKDQRKIITDVTGKDASQTPQMWALYKEVQSYYDKGMRVPDDVTLLLCDDNWGNIRKLPSLTEKPRKGGYGIYYHFDYVGGPRNYKWLNTNPISKTWEQMHLAYEYNARQIWVVNVGDLKPMEFPISFFLDYAWNPDKWPAEKLQQYSEEWATQQFGAAHAKEIAKILTLYTKYNSRRKPELLDENTYSLTNYNEFTTVVGDYNKLRDEAEKLATVLDSKCKDSFYELVLHPVQACANLNELYFEVAKNRYYLKQKNAAANAAAARVRELFAKDKAISRYYNDTLANGKWSHMMDQTHIGYTYWQQPNVDKMPEVAEINPDSAKTNQPDPVLSTSQYNGFIAVEGEHYNKAIPGQGITWKIIPHYGNTLSGITPWPVTAARVKPTGNSPHLEYNISLKDTDTIVVTAYISPSLDFRNKDGLYYAVSIDNEEPQIVNIATKVDSPEWGMAVSDNIRKLTTKHHISKAGVHTLKYWMVDPAVVLQRLVIDTGGLKPSYLGPPENMNMLLRK
ncbi:glycosyl hydrolase 115 family protein [Mucilaginibacter jinjuensis]|uniref:Glycosyl hydrolase 115 family protein n=1 Tax=Mucilaginibacter jinjuensis TaxID=1176721 RepID=A0ABY7TDE7_9SPHI|nr:glycosyl hydrolase 115 family protein [Mucilaginibacter jinjuensis]WCT14218.1 glycosyl hydrolase 115 family protein [Mucilaginibacter jinjuensis]